MQRPPSAPRPRQIISGGQTGVDRAALDVAIQLGIPHGGYCPRGRRAEDGRIGDRYQLVETASAQYHVRTEENVLAADATLILCRGTPTGGTQLTYRLTCKHRRPCLILALNALLSREDFAIWLCEHGRQVLNIAGPRESQSPGIYHEAGAFLTRLWSG